MNKNTTDGFNYICKITDLQDNAGKRFIVNETEIAVFKISNKIYALNNICPHQQTAMIYDGFIEDDCVVCPAHGWKFNLHNGRKPGGGRGLDSYEINVIDDDVYVNVIAREYNW